MQSTIKILELFSGYGTATFALKRLGIDHEVIGYSDIDKYANQCFQQNHGGKELGDCTKVDPNDLEDFDLLTGGFPCQAFSIAGKGLGELDTRGTLFNEIIRIAEVKKPNYMLLENVKGLISKKHQPTFQKILSELERIGYYVSWKVLNTKDYGIPQNRERVFFVCFRDFFEWKKFRFPEKEELKILLKDILEDEVDEKYYISKERIEKLLSQDKLKKYVREDTANCLTSSMYKGIGNDGVTCVPVLTPDRLNKRQNGRRFKTDGEPMFTLNTQDRHGILQINDPSHSSQRVYDTEGISPTISAGNNGGGKEPCKIIQINNPKHSNDRVYSKDGISPTLNTMQGGDRQPFILSDGITCSGCEKHVNECDCKEIIFSDGLTIRKLTPKECFRLQGFLDDEVNLEGLSNTQQYKLAGNGQSVNVVAKIFEKMFEAKDEI